MDYEYKLFEFNIYTRPAFNEEVIESSDDDNRINYKKDANIFSIQMFGIDEQGTQCSIIIEDYKPFFYVKIPQEETRRDFIRSFEQHIKSIIGNFYVDSIAFEIEQYKKLYEFDNGQKYNFIKIIFNNTNLYNKVKKLWYSSDNESEENEKKLKKEGYDFNGTKLELYETSIPPLLRFFHIQNISPSGWVKLPNRKYDEITGENKSTKCHREFIISKDDIIPLIDKETRVPYKVMSFDIEASSSHGDFPVPIKSYKKLATNIVDYFDFVNLSSIDIQSEKYNFVNYELREIIQSAFGFISKKNIDLVYPKTPITDIDELNSLIDTLFRMKVKDIKKSDNFEQSIEMYFNKNNIKNKNIDIDDNNDNDKENDKENDEDENDSDDEQIDNTIEELYPVKQSNFNSDENVDKNYNIVDILCDFNISRENKLNELVRLFGIRNLFPQLEGDKVTFIGSTFLRYGETEPYLNHCMVLNSCLSLHDVLQYSVIETFETERDMLIAWTDLVSNRENPDIIIGYNIFGFDYEFMFRRSQELNCVHEFLQLSKNKDELCATTDYKTGKIDIDRSLIVLASGAYDLSIIKMPGRLQVDMLNWFRRTENLTSYKLDFVSGYYIGDVVKNIDYVDDKNTKIFTNNMAGLYSGSYIHFEEINHSSDYYKQGAKFKVINVNKQEKWFEIEGIENPYAKILKWGLAKDDVSAKDIFRMTNEGPESRAVIAKYCIQDCNLVHYLFNKVDVMTDLIEMAKICSVPMSFLVFRGQGIKLTSYVAKKCREKGTLMPTINRGSADDGYEGAIVLVPKCGLYLDNPIDVGDFASLYPSSMLSENLSPDSKVWSKIFNLYDELIKETGQKDENGRFIYDNLPGCEYVDVTFDTYRYVRKTPKGRAEKVKSGYKICRFVQPRTNTNGKEEKAIMPAILQELLKARKDTRKIQKDTDDDFMWNILEKRQLAYKATANSLYGQLGAKTSTFYEPDIAASTTATGRLLLTYAKRVIEECYGNTDIDTKYGMVNTKAEYIYGDTDSVFFTFNLSDKQTGEKIVGEKALEIAIEVAQEACHNVSKFLKQPHDFEYEKTFMPFCLLSKKRYVGILYETDPKKGKRKEMGIVLKRRDNAPIVKDVYGGVIDILMKERNLEMAVNYVNSCMSKLINGNTSMEKLIITKSLRSFYKNPKGIAHKVLADRIGEREPGNKPSAGDRVSYVYFVNSKKPKSGEKILQGDKIETPTFIRENNLQIDYAHYITNQIMKPLSQLFGLVLEELWKAQKPSKEYKIQPYREKISSIKNDIFMTDPKKIENKINKIREKEVCELIFNPHLIEIEHKKNKTQKITNFFKVKK
jgi:DNA polymerase elongation subunit (family B)